ncbi:MAG TPA: helix-turn-helix transcriptional regulator, partial [Thermoanaerobaculia bacterium]|nr:helix-turn-helix transcriptional regulator [Thermoanaerobaculia bacterium]
MPPQRSPEALSLVYLRLRSGWSQQRLAAALGLADVKQISRYESGAAHLSRERLDSLVAALGYDPEDVDFLLFAGEALAPPPPEADGSPVALTHEELRSLDRAVLSAGWAVVQALRAELRRWNRKGKADAARREAGKLWEWVKTESREGRRELVECFPELWSWALAVRVSHESERAAAHRVDEALELADLAVRIAGRVPAEAAWRSRIQGYAWAYVANARRVANDFDGADKAFARAWNLWQAGAVASSDLLSEWRLLDLEASLRREQQRFPEALDLLGRARSLCADDETAAGRILLKTEHVLSQKGDLEGALAALEEAIPYLERSREPRLLFGLWFNKADNLYHLGRHAEAAELLPEVRRLAVQQANELDLVRVLWLEAKIHAGQGRMQQATAALEQVRRDFAFHKLPYDAALSSLDLALLWLEAGRSTEVLELALGMALIFASKKIHREALAALTLFYEAARQETATMELTRHVIATIEKVRRSAPRPAGRGR